MLSRLFGLCPAACIDPFHATSYSSTRLFFHGFSSNRDKNMRYLCVFSVLFFLEKGKKKKKRCSNDVSNIECWNCCLCFRFFLFFNVSIKISLLVRKRRDEKTKFVNFSSLFFFSPFSINFNSSFQKHLPYVIASNVWNYRMFADARANWNTELRKWNYR